MRKPTLEQRIARLESIISRKATKKESRKINRRKTKNESALRPDMLEDLQSIFSDRFCADYFSSMSEFKDNIFAASQGQNDQLVDDAIMWMVEDYDYDEEEMEGLRDEIANDLAQLSDDFIHDFDDWYEDDEFESVKRTRKPTRNEDVRRLPNKANADRVCDVLSGWAGTSWHRPQEAIDKLDQEGILENATNRWYPTVADVAEAIELCWNDGVGAVGKGAARFFMGNIGGKMKCSLTLFPTTGGDSRARNIVLKFDWPMPDDMMV